MSALSFVEGTSNFDTHEENEISQSFSDFLSTTQGDVGAARMLWF